jgi:hypothetical protein
LLKENKKQIENIKKIIFIPKMFKPFSDVKIIVDSKDFYLNKIVLVRIPYFANLLNVTDGIVTEDVQDSTGQKKKDSFKLECDLASFEFIINELYENGKVVVQKYDAKLFKTLEKLEMKYVIDEFLSLVSQEGFVSIRDENLFEYLIMCDREDVQNCIKNRLFTEKTENAVIQFHNLIVNLNLSLFDLYNKRNNIKVVEALFLFYEDHIQQLLKKAMKGKVHTYLQRMLVLYNKPISSSTLVLALAGIQVPEKEQIQTKIIDRTENDSKKIVRKRITINEDFSKKKKTE